MNTNNKYSTIRGNSCTELAEVFVAKKLQSSLQYFFKKRLK